MTDTEIAYQTGFDDFGSGYDRDQCPYTVLEMRWQWTLGWDAAQDVATYAADEGPFY